MAQMWYKTTIPGVGTGTTMPLPTGGQPRRPQVLERCSDQTRNQAFAETDESLPVRSGYWAMKALIRANDMLRDGIGVVLVLVALASPAAAQSGLSGIGSALFDGYYGAQMQQNYIEIQRQQIELMKRGIVPPPLPPMPSSRPAYVPPRTIDCFTLGNTTTCNQY